MKILITVAAGALLIAAAMTNSLVAQGQGVCDHGGNHVIQVRTDANDEPELSYQGGSAAAIRVCLGDSIQWVLNGPTRDFYVEFTGGIPHNRGRQAQSTGRVVDIIVGGEAERGQGYDYFVQFIDGGGMDPRILVD